MKVWDAESGDELFSLHALGIERARWSLDETRIVADFGGCLFAWDADTGEELFTVSHFTEEPDDCGMGVALSHVAKC
ncbi:MAG: hypothetical protein M5R40_20195 [Anaerolineae bacterium]|nr:hypothetical protein [Anaerolineae bacterium]